MKFALVLVLLFTLTANAQSSLKADSVRTVVAPKQFTSADTVRALHKLFKSRRTRGSVLLGITGAGVIAGNIALSNDPGSTSYSNTDEVVVGTGILLLYASPLWVVGTSMLVRFSQKRERMVTNEFIAKHTLPHKIQRRLKPSLFTIK